MRLNRTEAKAPRRVEGESHAWRRAWLGLTLHLNAVRYAPGAWLKALWWRLLGKRVRARVQFGPLLAASPRAYALWLLDEPSPPTIAGERSPPLVALVAAGPGQDETLRSLEGQDMTVLALGTPGLATMSEVVERVDWSVEPWLMPLAAGDLLAADAAAAYRAAAVTAEARIVYADDDLLDAQGMRAAPHFKPGWNAELVRHLDYLTGACIVRARPADLAHLSGPDWASRLVATIAGQGGPSPVRLPYVLHHRRSRPAPVDITAVGAGEGPRPKVSVIVPTRNRVDLLRTCLEGVARTDYPDLEVIVVDNGSDDPATLDYLANLDPARYRVLRDDGAFNFSRLNNRAAGEANGDLLCLLNNDIEVLAPDWLTIMVRQALRPEVGVVGARLLYPDGRIQHAGVVMGICGGAAHAHRLLDPGEEGYFRRHALPQFVSALTAACVVVRRESFEAVGGFDESFAVAFNDVDLCLRLNARGWQSLYEPRATLVHHESVSRGFDRDPVGAARFAGELAALKERWHTDAGQDEEIDPWHHPQLSRFAEHFVVRL